MRPDSGKIDRTRIDKWLWAARFFKTRTLASEAVAGGKVELNGERPKPSKEVKAGDELHVHLGPYVHVVRVRAISERRGPASMAATLYEETAASITERERLREQLRVAPAMSYEEKGRPTKKDRRDLSRFIDRSRGSR